MNSELGVIREQLRLIAQALNQISDKPEALSDMIDSIKSLNQKQFESALEKANLPRGVECITIVETITAVIPKQEIKYEKVCTWKRDGVFKKPFKEQAANSLDARTTASLQKVLEDAGLIECHYVKTINNGSVITATIPNTICPGFPEPG